jgi:hypothetical protein
VFRDELEVDVDGGRPPAEEDRRRPARQVADPLLLRRYVEGSQKAPDPLGVR